MRFIARFAMLSRCAPPGEAPREKYGGWRHASLREQDACANADQKRISINLGLEEGIRLPP